MRHIILPVAMLIVLVVTFSVEAVTIPEAEIIGAIEKAVHAKVDDEKDVEITTNYQEDVVVAGTGQVEIKGKLLTSGTPRGVVPVKVEMKRGAVELKTWTTTVNVRYFATVAVAGRRIHQHEAMSEAIVSMDRRDVTELREDHYITDPAGLDGLRAKRTILQGKLIDRASLESIPVVNRGDDITVIAEVGSITVSLSARANEDGRIGDEIQVVNKDSHARLRAKIIDTKRAKLVL